MSAYEKLARLEDDAEVDEINEYEIEELTKMKEYDYFWDGFGVIWWDNVNFMNRKWGFINKIDKKIKHEWRWWLYILISPVIFLILILSLLKRIIACFLLRPNGRKKRLLWLMFVWLIIITVLVIVTLIVIFARMTQSTLINNYIVRVAFTDYEDVTDAVAQLK